MTSAPAFGERKGEYRKWWSSMVVNASRVRSVEAAADYIIKNRATYTKVEQRTGVPWFMVGAIHWREASGSFKAHLHNGDPLTARTYHVPAGRPKGSPPFSWDESADDALMMPPHSLQEVSDWSIERILYETEKYNGWGYWLHGDHTSAYLWAGTDIDHGGKYVADHVFSSTAQDVQNGAAPIMHRVIEACSEPVHFDGEAPSREAAKQAPDLRNPNPKPQPPITSKVDPQAQVGGLLNTIFNLIQSILKRKS